MVPLDLTGCGLTTGTVESIGWLPDKRRRLRRFALGAFFAFARSWFSRRVLRAWQLLQSSWKLSNSLVPPSASGLMWSNSKLSGHHLFFGLRHQRFSHLPAWM
ncbi:MAG: hypothetical protein OXH86_02745 [Acidimicrobiaceae bacterium]|nr:hypothetical protein [Acidimicrobiaceae bacterium]